MPSARSRTQTVVDVLDILSIEVGENTDNAIGKRGGEGRVWPGRLAVPVQNGRIIRDDFVANFGRENSFRQPSIRQCDAATPGPTDDRIMSNRPCVPGINRSTTRRPDPGRARRGHRPHGTRSTRTLRVVIVSTPPSRTYITRPPGACS